MSFSFNLQNHAEGDGRETAQDIYGANAVTGSESKDPLEGRQVTIQTTGTKTISLNPAGEASEGNEKSPNGVQEEDPSKKPEGTEEEDLNVSIGADIANQIEANKALETDLTGKGVNFKALEEEYVNTGSLSAASMEALDKAGYPKEVVDAYIAGLQASAEKFETAVFKMAGGKEAYAQVTGFIKAQGKAYVDAFNAAIDTGNLSQLEMIIRGVQSQITVKKGTAQPTILGNKAPNTGIAGFTSRDEMVKAMNDRRYGRDPGYTKEVRQKTLASTFL